MNAPDEDPAGGYEPLTTREGWRDFVDTAVDPPSLTAAPIGDPELAMVLDEARLAYHSRLAVVATPTIQQISSTGRRLVVLNRGQLSARRGLLVTGAAGTGKTTAVTQLGKTHELALRRRYPTGGPQLPVVYVTLPPAATPRMLAVELARFLGLPVLRRSNLTDVTEVVCSVLVDLGASLIIVDELHNLNLATRSGAEASDQLKYFSERLPATFVYVGIDLERTGLFTGTRGRQIAARFAAVHTQAFGYATAEQRAQWRALVATLDQTLRLRAHRPGTLVTLAEHLHARTGGMIGSLSHLIRGAAVDAIITGDEKITRARLAAIPLDYAAEAHHARNRRRTSTRTSDADSARRGATA